MQLKRSVFHLFCLIFLSNNLLLSAQSQLSSEAEEMYRNNNFEQAQNLYADILKKFPSNAIYNHRYGVSLYETNSNTNLAEKHLTFAANKGIRLANFYLAKVKFKQYQFEEAIAYYNKFKNYIRRNDPRHAEIKQEIERCEKGLFLLKRVEEVDIIDTLVVPFEMFFKQYNISHETGSFSNICEDGNATSDSLYLLYLPEKGDRSFFSEFTNAIQKRDIFKKDKLLDAWTEAKPIDPINTEANEVFPFLRSDGLTMYFSSDRQASFGGYDIFVTRYSSSINNFLPPQPIGMPFNSFGNDYLYVIDEFRNIGWFASDRHNTKGFVTIYKFTPNDSKKVLNTRDNTLLRSAALLHDVKSDSDTKTMEADPVFVEQILPADTIEYVDDGMIEVVSVKELSFNFVVNDSTIYTRFADFKSRDALSTYKTYLSYQNKKDSLSNVIMDYRIDYESVEDHSERRTLTDLILNSETKLHIYTGKLDSLEQRSRKLEIDALKAYTKLQKENEAYQAPWKPKPLEIKIPKNIPLAFYNPYLQNNYMLVFSPDEISQLKECERNKLIADNLVLDWQEILMKLNRDPEADRIIVEKLIERDSAFADPKTRAELAKMAEEMRHESTDYYIKALTGKYKILHAKNMVLNTKAPNSETAKTLKQIQREAEFQYYNASSKTSNFTDYYYLNFDETQQTTGHLETSIDILERGIIIFDKTSKTLAEKKLTPADTLSNVPLKLRYKVQIGIFKNQPNQEALSKLENISIEEVEGTQLKRYYAGEFSLKEPAEAEALKADKAGFIGAFVVPFVNGKKRSWDDIETLKTN